MKKKYIEPTSLDTNIVSTYMVCVSGKVYGDSVVESDYGGVDEEGDKEPATKFREDESVGIYEYGYVNSSLW